MTTTEIEQQHKPCIARSHRMQWEEAQQCYVLLYPEGMITLNASAHEILLRCDGEHSVADIVNELHSAYPGAQLQDEVLGFVQLAQERGWVKFAT